MSIDRRADRPHSPEPFPAGDPVTDAVLSEEWGRMPGPDEDVLEGALADVPQTGEPTAAPDHGEPGEQQAAESKPARNAPLAPPVDR
jgi:hypothetical protein